MISDQKILQIGVKRTLPDEYVTKVGAFLAKRGSGKTYATGVITEEFLKKEIPFIIIDPMSAYYGLREKYPIVIFGGRKADIKIEPTDGIILAELIVKNNICAIFDLAEWSHTDMRSFVTEFLTKLYELNDTPRHIFLEEADIFAPQKGRDNSRESLASVDTIVRRGRQYGIGLTMITQRPAVMHKDVLSQADIWFFMHLISDQDLSAVKQIIQHSGMGQVKDIIQKIVKYKAGEALIYSPEWLGKIEDIKFREKETYHAGRTPKLGEKIIEPRLVPVNLTKILSFLENYDQEDPEQQKVKDIELQAKYARFFDQKISIPLSIATAILVAGAMGWLVV